MDRINDHLKEQLQKRAQANALRKLPTQQKGVDFCSNDYLGFAQQKFPNKNLAQYGATGSRLISGNHIGYEKLEATLAAFHQSENALVFGSGYQANLGLLSAIASRHDTLLYDQLAHASIRDGIGLSKARSFSFKHNDVQQLADKLKHATGRKWVIVESVYSMDGDEAPLTAIQTCCEQFGAALIVDEAHAIGVLGPQGRGLVVELGLTDKVWARVITFGKAIGCHGAAVLGSDLLHDFLVNFSRPFIYTTGLPQDTVERIGKSYECLLETDQIEALQKRIEQFREGLDLTVKSQLIASRSAIQSLLIPGNEAVKFLARQLQEAGFDIRPILHPTVPKGSERLRICLHSFNEATDIDRLVQFLNRSFYNE